MPQQQPFRFDPISRVELVLLPDEEGEDYVLHRIAPSKERGRKLYVEVEENLNHRIPDEQVSGIRIEPWGTTDYMEELAALATEFDRSLGECAACYGTVTLPATEQGWRFHPALGFTRKR